MTVPPNLAWLKKYPASVDWSAALPVRPLYEILDNAVRDYADEVGTNDKNIKVDSILAQSQQDEASAAYLRSASSAALLSGDIGAGAAGLKGLSGGLGGLGGGTPGSLGNIGGTAGNLGPLY